MEEGKGDIDVDAGIVPALFVLRRVLGTLVEPIYSARTVFLYTALSREIAMSPCASFVLPQVGFPGP